jgi:hypothetical protein
MRENSTTLFCPIVIDSPNQQDQDGVNLERMLRFIRDERPRESQLVLALVDDCGIDFGGSTVELYRKNSVLGEEEYEELSMLVREFIDLADQANI